MKGMRLFIAIAISESIRDALSDTVKTLRQSQTRAEKIKWVEPENYHLTLKFFGEVAENQLNSLTSALAESVKDQKKAALKFKGIGAFPNLDRARVLWAGAEGEVEAVSQLAQSIDQATVQAGLTPADKPFSSHLTLARFMTPPSKPLLDQMKIYSSQEFGSIIVERISLIQSQLTPHGPIYSVVQEFNF